MGWTDAFIYEVKMKRGMANASAFVMCLSPLYLTRPNCLRELMWAMDMCAVDKTKKLCVLPMHPSVSFAGCKAIVSLAATGCAAQVILPADDRLKVAPTQLQQLNAHKLSDAAIELLQRLIGTENVGINAEWLKLQPWMSDAEGENWEETSQPWAGPCEVKSVELKKLLESLCVDVQAAVQADCSAQSSHLVFIRRRRRATVAFAAAESGIPHSMRHCSAQNRFSAAAASLNLQIPVYLRFSKFRRPFPL